MDRHCWSSLSTKLSCDRLACMSTVQSNIKAGLEPVEVQYNMDKHRWSSLSTILHEIG